MRSYFNFNRNEKIGVVTLAGLILILTVVLNVGYRTYIPDPFDVDRSTLSFLNLNNDFVDSAKTNDFTTNNSSNSNKDVIRDFDPNKILTNDWMKMGFSQKQAESIISYRERFGPFKRKEDLKKLYVISAEKYLEIENHIKIEEIPNDNSDKKTNNTSENSTNYSKQETIELNSATKEDLVKLKGIGEYYANRIIDNRNKIGGYIDFDQIQKLSISEDAFDVLIEFGEINPLLVKKTNINTATKEQLKSIPYSNWLLVSAILKERQVNPIQNLNFLTDAELSLENRLKFEYYIVY